jgi:hypothetical protein
MGLDEGLEAGFVPCLLARPRVNETSLTIASFGIAPRSSPHRDAVFTMSTASQTAATGRSRDPRPARARIQPEPLSANGKRGVIVEKHPIIEGILDTWRERLGSDYDGYRGHAYRVFNLTVHGANARDSEIDAIAAAAAFHDLAIWSDRTFDYIERSCVRAERWIIDARRNGIPIRTSDAAAIALMISEHHKLTRYRGQHERLVDAFRRADLLDLSRGMLSAGLPRKFGRRLRKTFPTAGFHRAIVRIGTGWVVKHPTQPLPMVKF